MRNQRMGKRVRLHGPTVALLAQLLRPALFGVEDLAKGIKVGSLRPRRIAFCTHR